MTALPAASAVPVDVEVPEDVFDEPLLVLLSVPVPELASVPVPVELASVPVPVAVPEEEVVESPAVLSCVASAAFVLDADDASAVCVAFAVDELLVSCLTTRASSSGSHLGQGKAEARGAR